MPSAQIANAPDPLEGAIEIVSDRLYFASFKTHPSSFPLPRTGKRAIHFFSVDNELVYWNFFLDFGPLNLGQLYRFCSKLNYKMNSEGTNRICYYSSATPNKRANAVFLICAWQVLYLDRTPEEAFRGFRDGTKVPSAVNDPLPPFHDASPCVCTYDLTVLDCLRGLAKARMYRYFDFDSFDLKEYEHFEQVENGDLNWIMKDRILAFAGPHNRREISREGYCTLTPEDYIPYFQQKKVDLVVRLNKKCYDEKKFTKAEIRHTDNYYLDGSIPPMKILQKIIASFESVPPGKAFAVHCKAGLGRTGTCIGSYMMKHYKFTAAEVIGWMRICRPGCVIGPQQHFLQDVEQQMWHEGDLMRLKPQTSLKTEEENKYSARGRSSPTNKSNAVSTLRFGSLSVQDHEPVNGIGQADALLAARRGYHNQSPVQSPGC